MYFNRRETLIQLFGFGFDVVIFRTSYILGLYTMQDLELLHQLDQRMWARCLALGGTVSGEHGCGMGKVPALQDGCALRAPGPPGRLTV